MLESRFEVLCAGEGDLNSLDSEEEESLRPDPCLGGYLIVLTFERSKLGDEDLDRGERDRLEDPDGEVDRGFSVYTRFFLRLLPTWFI